VPDPSKADSVPPVEPRRNLLREDWLAFATLTRWIPPPRPKPGESPDEYAKALAFLPIAGLIAGVALAFADRGLSGIAPPLPRSALTIGLAVLLTGGLQVTGVVHTFGALIRGRSGNTRAVAWPGAIVASLVLIAEIFVLGTILSRPARGRAIVLAILLSRWAIVPIGYGLRPIEESGLGIPFFGGITFYEFAISSVIALGAAMGLYDVVGLAAIIALALTILGLRLLFSRRLGGVGGHALAAGAAVCELVTFAVLAALSAI
jgi:adenosylcobinamide-GDP ribazoletransferase